MKSMTLHHRAVVPAAESHRSQEGGCVIVTARLFDFALVKVLQKA